MLPRYPSALLSEQKGMALGRSTEDKSANDAGIELQVVGAPNEGDVTRVRAPSVGQGEQPREVYEFVKKQVEREVRGEGLSHYFSLRLYYLLENSSHDGRSTSDTKTSEKIQSMSIS